MVLILLWSFGFEIWGGYIKEGSETEKFPS